MEKKISKGDMVRVTHFCDVVDATPDSATLEDLDTGLRFDVEGRKLIERLASADESTSTEVKDQTAVIEILTASIGKPVTAVFRKQLTKEDHEAGRRQGQLRTLRGRVVSLDALRGRTNMEDLEKPRGANRRRQVCHRELISVTVDGVTHKARGKK